MGTQIAKSQFGSGSCDESMEISVKTVTGKTILMDVNAKTPSAMSRRSFLTRKATVQTNSA